MKKINLLIIIFAALIFGACTSTLALQLDMSVDEEINKKYDYNKLNEQVLPDLPQHLKNSATSSKTPTTNSTNKSTNIQTSVPKNIQPQIKTSNSVKLASGTKFKVKSNIKLSNWNGNNSLISFTSTAPVYKNSVTIPAGTTFKGVVALSHNAQITGNGALLELMITSMSFNGKTVPIEAKVTRVNSKNIFFNRIKGERKYWANVGNQIAKGNKFYQKTRNVAYKMQKNAFGSILSPLPIVTGIAGAAVTSVTSPLTALFKKGQNISLPAGTEFEIKLTRDVYLN